MTTVSGEELRQLIERIERLEAEKADIVAASKDVYAEAKARGYDTKAMRRIVAERKKSEEERAEMEAILDLYQSALGMN